MASVVKTPPTMSTINVHPVHPTSLKLLKYTNSHHVLRFPKARVNHSPVYCTKLNPWEHSPVTYAPTIDADSNLLKKTSNIFETLSSDGTSEAPRTSNEDLTGIENQPQVHFQFLKWPMWLLGPSLLLTTGMVPTLWLPLSSVFLGPNIDCIFNLGATLFLLMADSCSRPKNSMETCNSKPPLSYKFWNMVATVSGFVFPLMMLFGSQRGFLQPQLAFIPYAVLLGPYLLLLSVQILTELLTWHWQSPVWLVTPVVYESYRVLQLMRGLKLGPELNAPIWILHMIRGLVCWWILILGIQLLRVAWFVGFTARAQRQPSSVLLVVNIEGSWLHTLIYEYMQSNNVD